MPLLIRNGEIVTADSRTRADIFVENETITRIGRDIERTDQLAAFDLPAE